MAIDALAWLDRIEKAEKKLAPWRKNAKKIVERYRGRDDKEGSGVQLNIHWSNQQLYLATVYARTPKAEVIRRLKGVEDPLAQELSEVMGEAVSFAVDAYDFDEIVEQALVDYGNAGLGQIRIRYKPYFRTVGKERIPVGYTEDIVDDKIVLKFFLDDGSPVAQDKVKSDAQGPFMDGDDIEEVAYEEVCPEFVAWDRFGWDTDARVWPDVSFCYIVHNQTKSEVKRQFGRKYVDKVKWDLEGIADMAEVFEVFDKKGRKVFYVARGVEEAMLDLGDPFKLEGFFPFPKPLLATTTSDKLIPVPLYMIVQDLYLELDEVQARITSLTKQMKVRGAYDSNKGEKLAEILQGSDGTLIPIEQWSEHMERGGLKAAVDFIPLSEINATLQTLTAQRESIINKIYEITGFSDIGRGATRASESAAAQKIKNEYLSTRINREVKKVSRFLRDLFRLIAEMQAEKFSAETFTEITGRPVDDGMLSVIRNDLQRAYKIDVQSDSMLIQDEDAEVERRSKSLNAMSSWVQAITPMVQQGQLNPEAAKAMILWVVGADSRGRQLAKHIAQINFSPMPPDPGMAGAEAGMPPA